MAQILFDYLIKAFIVHSIILNLNNLINKKKSGLQIFFSIMNDLE